MTYTYAQLQEIIDAYKRLAMVGDRLYDPMDNYLTQIEQFITQQNLADYVSEQNHIEYLELFILSINNYQLHLQNNADAILQAKLAATKELTIKLIINTSQENLYPFESKLAILQFLVKQHLLQHLPWSEVWDTFLHPNLPLIISLIPFLEQAITSDNPEDFVLLKNLLKSPLVAFIIETLQQDDPELFSELLQERYFLSFLQTLDTLNAQVPAEEYHTLQEALASILYALENIGVYNGKYLSAMSKLFTSVPQVIFIDKVFRTLEAKDILDQEVLDLLLRENNFNSLINVSSVLSKQIWTQFVSRVQNISLENFIRWLKEQIDSNFGLRDHATKLITQLLQKENAPAVSPPKTRGGFFDTASCSTSQPSAPGFRSQLDLTPQVAVSMPLPESPPLVPAEVTLDLNQDHWRDRLIGARPESTIRINYVSRPNRGNSYSEATWLIRTLAKECSLDANYNLIISYDFYLQCNRREIYNSFNERKDPNKTRRSDGVIVKGQINRVIILCPSDKQDTRAPINRHSKVILFNFGTKNIAIKTIPVRAEETHLQQP